MVKHRSLLLAIAGCQLTGEKNTLHDAGRCLDGYTCTAAGRRELATTSRSPITCDGHCGEIDDHCGGTLACGACPDHWRESVQDPSETDSTAGASASRAAPV